MSGFSQMLENSNLMRYLPTVIIPAIGDTLKMVIISAVLSLFFNPEPFFKPQSIYKPKHILEINMVIFR